METIEVVTKITADNLPSGLKWEEDGGCWRAEQCDAATFGCEWRWVPQNWKAFAKGEPAGEMFDFVLPTGGMK
jgi:hypothetical protein